MENKSFQISVGIARILLGWVFFWAFVDKLFGLGFATISGKAWLDGASPTVGFLTRATKGPFADFFQSMAGSPVVDWLFMLGLAGVGIALILGIGVRMAGISGALILVLIYLAAHIWPANNPFLTEHIVYAVLFIGFAFAPVVGQWVGLGKQWSALPFVQKLPILR